MSEQYHYGMTIKKYREQKGWSQQDLAEHWPKTGGDTGVDYHYVQLVEYGKRKLAGVSVLRRLCDLLEIPPWEFGLSEHNPFNTLLVPGTGKQLHDEMRKVRPKLEPIDLHLYNTISNSFSPLYAELWAGDLLTIYARGIAACQDLYYNGHPHHVEAILPLYSHQIALLAQQTSPLQQSAARLASQAQQLACERATDREDFGTARQAGQQAFSYAQCASDSNLQVAALISLANLGFHLSSAKPRFIRTHSKEALQAYQQAVSLFGNNVTPLLKGRTYAGMAEVYAMQGQFQEAMQAMGLAYESFPMKPEDDPAYPYIRASRYSLYVFGDAQSRLFLGQPKEAEKTLIAMQKETNDPQMEPITKLDMLYYQAEVQIQQGELEPGSTILTEAAILAKDLGSRLYFNKLAGSYQQLQIQWPREPLVIALEGVFQPW